ncbi:hypothetical protein [Ectobacillus ponti]|uniref:Uncharacterized protein n=1 Tax=Ectobacillus ponti TaxID=2961894 RepID=A0AA41XCV0_9BACI|nr:hypothetical protein [Ectobacillus ponti]MCP8969736.1 hypothetical protein [Ectobacillus ponti]
MKAVYRKIAADVMKKAWKKARQGAKRFGGKPSQYIAESMRIMWAYAKENWEENVEFFSRVEAREVKFVRRGNVSEKQAAYIVALLEKAGDKVLTLKQVASIENCKSSYDASGIIDTLKSYAYAPKWI